MAEEKKSTAENQKTSKSEKARIMRRFFGYLAKNKVAFIAGVILSITLAAVNIMPPLVGQLALAVTAKYSYGSAEKEEQQESVKTTGALEFMQELPYFKDFVEEGIDAKEMTKEMIFERRISRQMLFLLILAAVFILARVSMDFSKTFILQYLSKKTIMNIRGDMLKSLSKTKLSYFSKNKGGELISKIQNDTAEMENFVVRVIPSILNDPIMLILTIVILFFFNWKLTLVTFILSPAFAFLIIQIGKHIGKLTHKMQSSVADYTSVMQEMIFGIEAVKLFSKEKREHKKFVDIGDQFLRTSKKLIASEAASRPITEFFTMSALVGLVSYGGFLVLQREISFDALWGFILFMLNISPAINSLSKIVVNVYRARSAGERAFSIVDLPSEMKGESDLPEIETGSLKGDVEFNNVQYSYDGESDFRLGPINLRAKPGQIVALVGASGGGKSTIVRLLPKLLRVQQGELLIDGINVNEVKTSSLRKNIGMVAQENVLFYGTIKENILYGKADASDEELYEAARIANADEFIEKLPQGYNSMVAEKGASLSGGQRQRIALARAVIRQPKILILDEATSALDAESESYVQDALNKIIRRQTSFVIAHRLSTVKNADIIHVVEDGKIIESGKHDELLAADGKYKHLYSLQFL